MKLINPLSENWYDHCLAYSDEYGSFTGFAVWFASVSLPICIALSIVVYLLAEFPFVALGVVGALVLAGSAWLASHMVRAIRLWGAQ